MHILNRVYDRQSSCLIPEVTINPFDTSSPVPICIVETLCNSWIALIVVLFFYVL